MRRTAPRYTPRMTGSRRRSPRRAPASYSSITTAPRTPSAASRPSRPRTTSTWTSSWWTTRTPRSPSATLRARCVGDRAVVALAAAATSATPVAPTSASAAASSAATSSSGCSTPTPGSSPRRCPGCSRSSPTCPTAAWSAPGSCTRGAARRTIWFDGGVVDEAKHGETRHVHQGREVDEGARPAPRVDVDYVTGASLLARRTMLETVGLLPEDYFLYFEETDWCRRRAPRRLAGHGRAAGPDGAPQALERGPAVAVPSLLHDPEPLPLRRAGARRRRRGRAGPAARQVAAELAAQGAQRRRPSGSTSSTPWWTRAAADARAGRDGRNDAVSHVPWPDDVERDGISPTRRGDEVPTDDDQGP